MQREDNIKKRTFNDVIRLPHLILAIITLLWLNGGVYTYVVNYIPNIVKLLIFTVWFTIACFMRKKYFVNYLIKILPLLIFYGIVLVINIYTSSDALELYIATFRYLFIVYSIFLYYFNTRSIKAMYIIITILLLDIIYVGINTYIQLQINPSLSRFLATGSEMQEILLGDKVYYAIGSYPYAYSIVLIGLFILFFLLYDERYKIWSLISAIIILILLIKLQFTIALLLLIACGLYLLLTKIHVKNSSLILLIIIPIIFAVYACLPSLFRVVASFEFIPEFMSIRLNEISLLFEGGSMQGTDFFIRFELYSMSLKTFSRNFFVGSIDGAIGNHSSWLDLLGRLGLLSIPLFVFFINQYKFMLTKLKGKSSVYVKACFLYYLILGVINPAFFAQIFVTLFIIVPFCTFIYDRNREFRELD